MALTTTVIPGTIATALGQPAPTSPVSDQWEMWIADALMLIQERVTALGIAEATIGQMKLDYVIREAVVAQVKKPDDATQVSITVDDGTTSKSYRSGTGRVTILDDWWSMLGLLPRKGAAFEVDTVPSGAGVYPRDYWWSSPTSMEPTL